MGRALRLGQTCEFAAWEIAYIWEVATWENPFGKVPNIILIVTSQVYNDH